MKKCSKCKKPKLLKEFVKDKYKKSGYTSDCKECRNKRGKIYSKNNREKINNYTRQYRKDNNSKVTQQGRDQRKRIPWVYTLADIRKRCENGNCVRYKDYGGRGIKCLITSGELKELWFRDKAYLMKKPSIDREDNDGNYIFSNCRYIELSINSGKDKKKVVFQFTKNGDFIKEWESTTEAGNQLHISLSDISTCCNNGFKGKYKLKSAGGFIWKFTKE